VCANGIRPLLIGTLDSNPSAVLASETCGLDIIGANYLRDVEPGGWITQSGLASFHWARQPQRKLCIFEMIYFARPDSVMNGESLYSYRLRLGRQLAEESPALPILLLVFLIPGFPLRLAFPKRLAFPTLRG